MSRYAWRSASFAYTSSISLQPCSPVTTPCARSFLPHFSTRKGVTRTHRAQTTPTPTCPCILATL